MKPEPTADEIRETLARQGVTLAPEDLEAIRPRLARLLERLEKLGAGPAP